jgi:hypothetical protein
MAQRAPARTDYLDGVSAGRLHVDNVGAIDPGMAGADPLLAAGVDDDCRHRGRILILARDAVRRVPVFPGLIEFRT